MKHPSLLEKRDGESFLLLGEKDFRREAIRVNFSNQPEALKFESDRRQNWEAEQEVSRVWTHVFNLVTCVYHHSSGQKVQIGSE